MFIFIRLGYITNLYFYEFYRDDIDREHSKAERILELTPVLDKQGQFVFNLRLGWHVCVHQFTK